jgi:hypothetical protein
MFSQDWHEIYLALASGHKDYVDYLDKDENKGKILPNSHLTMEDFGPLNTKEARHIKDLAIFVVACTVNCCGSESHGDAWNQTQH